MKTETWWMCNADPSDNNMMYVADTCKSLPQHGGVSLMVLAAAMVLMLLVGLWFGPAFKTWRTTRRERKLRLRTLMDLMDSQDKIDEALAKATIRMNQAAG